MLLLMHNTPPPPSPACQPVPFRFPQFCISFRDRGIDGSFFLVQELPTVSGYRAAVLRVICGLSEPHGALSATFFRCLYHRLHMDGGGEG